MASRPEKLPPHDIEAEEAVIASILVDTEAIYRVAPILQPEDFFREKNAWAYEACLALWDRNEAINQVTVAHELARRERLEEVGGARLPQPPGRRAADRRRRRALRPHRQARRHLPPADRALGTDRPDGLPGRPRPGRRPVPRRGPDPDRCAPASACSDFVHIRELLDAVLGAAEAPRHRGARCQGHVRTGFMDLDTLLGGLKRSDLVILAARPSLGKTSLGPEHRPQRRRRPARHASPSSPWRWPASSSRSACWPASPASTPPACAWASTREARGAPHHARPRHCWPGRTSTSTTAPSCA